MSANKVKPTITKGVAKVPVIMQLEALECGAAALAMVMAYYGKWVPLEQVRLDCGVSRDGSKAKNIYIAAEHYGFSVKAFRMSPESIRENGQFPCIIHWNMNHFVVLRGFRGGRVYLNDPARGEVKVSWDEFDKAFTGVTIIPVPSESFEPSGKRKSTVDFARKRLTGAGAAVAFVMLTMAMHTMISEGQGGISGGQRQRIMIARAIAPKPKMLIFDEATSALDNKTQRQVSEALDAMGCTRIVIAHRLSTIRHCDRILVLDGGHIIEEGAYDELIEKNGFFAELVERQRLDNQ